MPWIELFSTAWKSFLTPAMKIVDSSRRKLDKNLARRELQSAKYLEGDSLRAEVLG
jgi:hypothetical protein